VLSFCFPVHFIALIIVEQKDTQLRAAFALSDVPAAVAVLSKPLFIFLSLFL
jgi:hypothetical protein